MSWSSQVRDVSDEVGTALAEVFANEHARVIAALIGSLRDIDLAEDALSDAVAQANEQWRRDGLPDRPGAWLLTTARRRGIDRIRREATFARKAPLLVEPDEHRDVPEVEEDGILSAIPDERLRLVFTCCHPALSVEAQVALTMRVIAGIEVEDIARAFLVSETAMAQRLTRAKRKIRDAGIPYRVPLDHELPDRLASVLAVVYLVFNTGYSAGPSDEVVRTDLMNEGIRLGRLLRDVLPDEGEVAGLLALMLLQASRSSARVDAGGELVLLEDQDRSSWDHDMIHEAMPLVEVALRRSGRSQYALQAAIAALHAGAPTYTDTDWPQIAALYGELSRVQPSPVVLLNGAVALAMAGRIDQALARLDRLSAAGTLEAYHPLHVARAEVLVLTERTDEAIDAFTRAIELAPSVAERAHLERRRRAVRPR